MMQGVISDAFGDQRKDRAFMTEWCKRWNKKVIDALPRERLLVSSPNEAGNHFAPSFASRCPLAFPTDKSA